MLTIAIIVPIHIWYDYNGFTVGAQMRVPCTVNLIVFGTAGQSAYGNKD